VQVGRSSADLHIRGRVVVPLPRPGIGSWRCGRVWLDSHCVHRDDLFRQADLDGFELVAGANLRFSLLVRIVGRLGEQRDVVLFDHAEPDTVALQVTHGERNTRPTASIRACCGGAVVEQSGCNPWQSLATYRAS
jgi:hypothetical protein